MKPNKLLDKFKLPYYIRGKSFSDASRLIESKFKDRNDNISNNTKKGLLERLKMAQEYIKQPQEEGNSFQEGGPMFSTENRMDKYDVYNNNIKQHQLLGSGAEDIVANAVPYGQVVKGIGKLAEGLSGGQHEAKAQKTQDWVSAFTDPIAAQREIYSNKDAGFMDRALTLALPNLAPFLATKNRESAANERDSEKVSREFNLKNNIYKDGGNLNNGNCGGPGQPPCPPVTDARMDSINKETGIEFTREGVNRLFQDRIPIKKDSVNLGKYLKAGYFDIDPSDPTGRTINRGAGFNQNQEAYDMHSNKLRELNPLLNLNINKFNKGGSMKKGNSYQDGGKLKFDFQSLLNKGKEALPGVMRYAPVATNALQLMNLDKPKAERLDRLDARYKPRYADERAAVNRVTSMAGNLTEAIQGATGGSTAALRSNLLAAHLNKSRAMSSEYSKIADINRQENRAAQQFDFRTDAANIAQSNLETDINARNLGAYNTAKSTLTSALGTDVGKIGLEKTREAYAQKMGLLYDDKGNYIGRIDKKTGKFISREQEPQN